jgi:4-amino-4-deoxy-L-arabinose transferase-like glycosyltransferase
MHKVHRLVWVALAAASLLKLYLALTTAGTIDAAGFADHLAKIEQLGGLGAYRVRGAFDNPFNSPPFMIHALRAMGWLAQTTHLPFPFWLRLPSILADAGSFLITSRMLARLWPARDLTWPLLLVALSPVSIMLSGYHGNTDSLMIFFVLLAVYLCERGSSAWAVGLAFGAALNIKAVPLMFAPAVLLYFPHARRRLKFLSAAIGLWLTASLPYVLQDPLLVARTVFGYESIYGHWGWTYFLARLLPDTLAYAHPPHDVIGPHAVYATVGKCVLLALIVASSFWMNRRGRKVPLFIQCGLLIALFLTLTPGFGSQYLVWLMPWIAVLAVWTMLAYQLAAASYLFFGYTCWLPTNCPPRVLQLATWGACILALVCYYRVVAARVAEHRRVAPSAQSTTGVDHPIADPLPGSDT